MNGNTRPTIDYTNKDYASLRQELLEVARKKLPAWTDHSANDFGVMLVELFAYMGDILAYSIDRQANESYLETAVERGSVLNMLRLIGRELRPPQPASADLSLLFTATANGIVTIPTGAEFQTEAAVTGESIFFQYIREAIAIDLARIPPTTYAGDGTQYKRFDTLPVVQVDAAITNEVVGSSAGTPNQRFALARSPLIDGTLIVDVDEGAGPIGWELEDTLLNSLSNDRHYIVLRDENDVAWIEFGDNRYGQIPRRGRNNILATYRVGGGVKGNVPPLTINQAVSDISDLELVFNGLAASGGVDAEPLDEAVQRGPQIFRAMDRAVTVQDFEAHAREFGVGKARARGAGWNRIELYVAPVGGGQPTDTLKEDLRVYLDSKRMMSTILDVQDPDYINVFIAGTLEIESYYFMQQVQQQAENAILNLLAFDNVDFEDTLYLSKIYEAIEAIEGLRAVNVSHFALHPLPDPALPPPAGQPLSLPFDGTLRFGWSEIPQAGYSTGILFTEVIGGRRAV